MDPHLGRFQPGWGRSWSPVRRRAGEPELGQRRREERRGRPGLAARQGAAGRGAGGGPSPGISGDQVTALAEREPSVTRGPAVVWVPRPLLQQSTGLAARSLPTLTPSGGAAPRPPGPLCYGGVASTPSCRRVSTASSYCRNYPTPSYCRVFEDPGASRRDSPPAFGGRGVSPTPSRLRDTPGPSDCGFTSAPGDCLIPVARGGRSIPEATGSRRFSVAPSYSRDPSVAGDCRVSAGPDRWGGSGLSAFSGLPARPQAR